MAVVRLHRRKIVLFDAINMMLFMSSYYVSCSSHSQLMPACYSCSFPHLISETVEHGDIGHPHQGQFFKYIFDVPLIGTRMIYKFILLKSWKRSAIISRDTQGAIGKNTLGIYDMNHDLFDC